MKVLVIGSGGREHALLWKLAHSPSVKEVYVIPGNDGMTDVAHLIPVKGTEDILDFARLMEVDLTVAGLVRYTDQCSFNCHFHSSSCMPVTV